MNTGVLAANPARTRAADLLQLSKPRLNALVIATTAGGYYMGLPAAPQPALGAAFVHTMIGTALVAASASAFNQIAERRTDGLMVRTRLRPLPDGRMQPAEAAFFAAAAGAAGLLQLALGAHPTAALVALATLLSYTLVYTPLKRRTSFATVVGAVPGALPPLIGWAAARGSLEPAAWTLFLIGFLWQLPHFLAIAWIYRDDYARAGLPMLPVLEPDGASTGRQSVLYAAALLPAGLAPAALGLAGPSFVGAAIALGAGYLWLAVRFARRRTPAAARRLFVGSLVYLPLVWAAMIAAKA
ncbi:MAG TPA: heme o synthase [Vicinamibacterales bacterium]|nr:heme o synthase [Vicinamibacterales bacterium]